MRQPILRFEKGTISIYGDVRVPYSRFDPRANVFRAQAIYYGEILDFLDKSGVEYLDYALDLVPCPELKSNLKLRDYQKESLDMWEKAGRKGIIVLPTGSGKTIIAIHAIETVNKPSIIVVPTIDLMEQWRSRLHKEFGIEIGIYGGGENILGAVTVSTYDSAYLRAAELGNRFSLIVFDECHHLPAKGYRQIAEMFTASHRLGLTATYEREDGLHRDLPKLIGGIVYHLKPRDLAGQHLSQYSLERIGVSLMPNEMSEYTQNYRIFRNYLNKNRIELKSSQDLVKLIWRSNRDAEARKALLARNRAQSISLNSESKIDALAKLLRKSQNERIIIFTQHNQLVHRISKKFLIPFITHKTEKKERSDILHRFREGRYRIIVTSKVLDEGIDVPEASLGIILSGTGSSREFIQRLGRLLRKRKGKKAKLVEIISTKTSESTVSWRRKKGLNT